MFVLVGVTRKLAACEALYMQYRFPDVPAWLTCAAALSSTPVLWWAVRAIWRSAKFWFALVKMLAQIIDRSTLAVAAVF